MKIFKKILNSYKVKRIIKNLTDYKFFIEDMFFYFFSLFFTFNKKTKLTIITAADSQFFESLVQLIKSIRVHEPDAKIIVYDIGLDDLQIEKLNQFDLFQFKKFNFKKYPKFFSERDEFGKLGAYAWKSAIINEVLEKESNDIVIWFDAGNILTSKLSRLKKVILFNNFFSPQSSGQLKDWCHPKTLEYLNAPNNILNKSNLTGGLVGFNSSNTESKELANKWYRYSLIEECIAPIGSHRNNHRQDQSVLSILFYIDDKLNYSPKTKKFFSIKVNQNPGSRIYLLDSSEKSEFKILWLKKQDDITTNTISNCEAIWILNIKDIHKIERKYLKNKKIIFNITSNEDMNYLLDIKNIYDQNTKKYFMINSIEFSKTLIDKGFLSEQIYYFDDTTDLTDFRSRIKLTLSN